MNVSPEQWIRRRVYELRVPIKSADVLAVLQNLSDEQLTPPFAEVKLWLGLDEADPLPVGLDQLAREFCSVRAGGTAGPPGAVAKNGSVGHGPSSAPQRSKPATTDMDASDVCQDKF